MSTTAAEINVSERAQKFAQEVSKTANQAANEEELRIGMENSIRQLAADVGQDIDPENERTELSGRPDAVYGDLIIEYKDPNHSGNWKKEALYGRDDGDSGLVDYMYDIAVSRAHNKDQQEAILDRMVGVGTNGHKIFFCRYRPHKRIEPVEATQSTLSDDFSREVAEESIELVDVYDIYDGARAFLTYLRSLSRKPLTGEKLAEVFGPKGDVAQDMVQNLYSSLEDAKGNHPRVSTLYKEWDRVFGIVYGEDMGQIHDDRELFGNIYGLKDPDVRPLLFSVHTYYGLLMKMLSTELLAIVRDTPIEEAGLYEPNDATLKDKLESMEKGEQFELAGVEDFFEEGFFGWYLDTWDAKSAECVREVAEELTTFEPATPTIKSEEVRDILKDLYQELVPRVIRHDLGEYLTPDWLAEFTIEQTGYEGDGRVLDPACGSGTFLVESIEKIRQESDNEAESLLNEILNKVSGFDLNPISVIASRTNYLMALGELAFHSSTVRIPVYQCDSMLTPAKYVDVRSMGNGSNGEGYKISTREGDFSVPALGSQSKMEDLLSLVQEHVDMGSSSDEFLTAMHDQLEIGDNWNAMLEELYNDIHQLEQENRNGVWTELLRNRLAPEFTNDIDYIVGNPPWVNWESLSQEYRERTKDLWDRYGLFTLSGTEARMGGGKKDISMLFTYVSMDEYLKKDGELGFLITQTVFKSPKAGEGFRRFKLGGDGGMQVKKVHDMVDLQPFDASNRTALFVAQKGGSTSYPIPYYEWLKTKPGAIDPESTIAEVNARTSREELEAAPIQSTDSTSSWLTTVPGTVDALQKVVGESIYDAHEGSNTGGANGVYWIEILEKVSDEEIRVQNLPEMGRKDIEQKEAIIESDLVYPLVRGRNVDRFSAASNLHVILAQDPETRSGIKESTMRTEYPKTYQFLQKFEDVLRERALFKRYYNTEEDPFYSMYNVGPYTVKPYHVAWPEQNSDAFAAVLSPVDDVFLGETSVMPDHKAMTVGLENENEAHYLCAMLNSTFSRTVIERYTIGTQVSTHVLDNVAVPQYNPNNELHNELANLSIRAHQGNSSLEKIQEEIDSLASQVWGIDEASSKTLKESYNS
ncbi:Eco57I restriction-modification methylase domain-containing protein [Natrinema thermotolerans]